MQAAAGMVSDMKTAAKKAVRTSSPPPTPPAKKAARKSSSTSTSEPEVRCLFTRMEAMNRIRPFPRNPNKHPDRQIIMLAEIIKHHGWRHPIIVSERSGYIVAGHGSFAAAKLLGCTHVPIEVQKFKSEADEWAMILVDNKIAEFSELDVDLERSLLGDIQALDADMNLELAGYTPEEIGDIFNIEKPKRDKKAPEKFDDVDTELPGARSLKTDMVFTSQAKYNIPELLPNMFGSIPTPITTWAGPDATEECEHYFYNITSVMRGLDMTKAIFSFYAEDHAFERSWDEPAAFTSQLINLAPLSVVSPNFSISPDYPEALNIWQVYRSRWVGRYFQEAGLRVIPDVAMNSPCHMDMVLAGLPKGIPAISIQTHTATKTPAELAARKAFFKIVDRELQPGQVLIYGEDHGQEEMDGMNVFPDSEVIVLTSRLVKRRALMDRNKSGKTKFKK